MPEHFYMDDWAVAPDKCLGLAMKKETAVGMAVDDANCLAMAKGPAIPMWADEWKIGFKST